MYNDPNTGQFMWGNVIQDMLRNYMMMQMMNRMGEKKPTETLGETPVPPANLGQSNPFQDPQLIQYLISMLGR